MTNKMKNVPELRFPEFIEEWEEKRLGEVTIYKNGGSFENSVKNHGIFKLITLKSVNTEGELINSGKYIDDKSTETLCKGTLVMILSEQAPGLVGMTANITRNNKYVLNQRVAALVPKQGIDSQFLSKLINRNQKYFSVRSAGTKVKNISKGHVENFNFLSPNYTEQQKIGSFFSKLDRQIELEEQKLAKLEEQKKGYMQKLFSQKLRFKDENGNDYPEWEEKTIKDVYKVTRGYVLARKLMSDNPNSINKYPVYSSQTSNNGLMGYYSDYLYQDAITWTTDGANAGSVSFRQGKFYCTNVCGVLLNELGNSNVCMAEMLNNIAFKYVSKVGNPKLMNNVMAMIKLKFPCLEEQQAISKFLNVFSEVIDNQNKKVELLKERKEGLLQKMFV
ncbi:MULTISPECIES: restriction endonuclease subunit S [Bacteria]|uniref:restriction endonuclease subunit S n=1 Tax=Bacteria TaxID=2 RepID=UPI000360B2E7|nr:MULTISPECIES: restriction endonuclease subunit S [Bacteria]MDW3803173.1 restriction endonuclease subunit S [Staphylococcus saprophyticus]MDW3903401.1 restriction endonuclease subunit S [Staphylococcus saprophyticus]MDW4041127.1 restriction endonuclease subunit S [Staphylococcus saprophyticus]MDW4367319.1 restriction endonuclease subunit S [Staphylococcus saprophyticus]OEK97384.1 restriction endonuclease subunit S [Staphylococcus saprophyticus]